MKQKNEPLIIFGLVICLIGLFIISGLIINIGINNSELRQGMKNEINAQDTSTVSEELLNEDEIVKKNNKTTSTDSEAEEQIVDVDKDVNTITNSGKVEELTTTEISEKEAEQIVDVNKDVNNITDSGKVEELTTTEISEKEAEQIALKAVPGIITDIVKEKKYGQMVYTIEIDPNPGVETDVFIDIYTGEVLLIET